MAKRKNYGFEKRQKEIKRQKKTEAKRARRLQKNDPDAPAEPEDGLVVDDLVEDADDDADVDIVDKDKDKDKEKREAIRTERRGHDID